jgi:hypothetical protein
MTRMPRRAARVRHASGAPVSSTLRSGVPESRQQVPAALQADDASSAKQGRSSAEARSS